MAMRSTLFLLPLAMLCIACGGPGSGPVAKDQLDPLVRDKDLPLADQIKKIQEDKYIPEPEKQRSIAILQAKINAGQK